MQCKPIGFTAVVGIAYISYSLSNGAYSLPFQPRHNPSSTLELQCRRRFFDSLRPHDVPFPSLVRNVEPQLSE
jgi:hypothetical protein